MADEHPLLVRLRLAATSRGARLFRNNVGLGYVGRVVRREPGLLTLANARPIKFGLGKGSSDLIGWRTVTVTPDMVGKKVAVFMAVEAKTPNVVVTADQQAFVNAVNDQGGIGIIARSEDDLM